MNAEEIPSKPTLHPAFLDALHALWNSVVRHDAGQGIDLQAFWAFVRSCERARHEQRAGAASLTAAAN